MQPSAQLRLHQQQHDTIADRDEPHRTRSRSSLRVMHAAFDDRVIAPTLRPLRVTMATAIDRRAPRALVDGRESLRVVALDAFDEGRWMHDGRLGIRRQSDRL
jgi:hypothetical protein